MTVSVNPYDETYEDESHMLVFAKGDERTYYAMIFGTIDHSLSLSCCNESKPSNLFTKGCLTYGRDGITAGWMTSNRIKPFTARFGQRRIRSGARYENLVCFLCRLGTAQSKGMV